MNILKSAQAIVLIVLVICLSSCLRDVDLSEFTQISLQPKIEVDLLTFDITSEDWADPVTGEFKTILRDTVRFGFLDDSYMQNDLIQARFRFKHTSSIPQVISTKISFLSKDNRIQHFINIDVDAGSESNFTVREFEEFIGPDHIDVVKRSVKMAIEIERVGDETAFTGKLKFESKALFFFEF